MQKGDIVHIEYEIWIKGGKNELFETNIESVAKKENRADPDAKYAPMPMIIGFDRNMKKLEESFAGAEMQKDYAVEIAPADGAGDRDPKKVRLYLMREILKLPQFQKKEATYPEVGMDIIIEDKIGMIAGIYAGRVRVDFNNRLAGKTLNYKYKIVKKDESVDDRVKSLIAMEYGNSAEFAVAPEGGDTVTIVLPDVCKYDPVWFKAKYKIVADLRDILGLKLVKFIEEYRKKEEKKEEAKDEKEGHEGHDHAEEEKPADKKKE